MRCRTLRVGLTLVGVLLAIALLGACGVPLPATQTPDTVAPTEVPPTAVPPTAEPTKAPTAVPTVEPTAEPTAVPTEEPTAEPTAEPTEAPTAEPTEEPAAEPAGPAAIPHTLEGRENCDACHAVDSVIQPAPEDHAQRTNDMCQVCHQPASTEGGSESSTPAVAPEDMTADDCLVCHGPFTKLNELEPFYTTAGGETINPHMYVPHDSEKIVGCTNCHTPHDIPPQSAEDVAEPTVDWCYSACHHEMNFTPCTACHE